MTGRAWEDAQSRKDRLSPIPLFERVGGSGNRFASDRTASRLHFRRSTKFAASRDGFGSPSKVHDETFVNESTVLVLPRRWEQIQSTRHDAHLLRRDLKPGA